jgi:hypothetical protein
VKPEDASIISTGFTLKMGVFARLAQATFLLSQGLQLMKDKAMEDEAARPDKMAQLRRTSLALVHTADAEATARRIEFCAQSGLSLRLVLLSRSRLKAKCRSHLTKSTAPSYYFKNTIYPVIPIKDTRN